MAGNRIGTGVIGGKRKCRIAELLEHLQQIPRRTIEVLGGIMGINPEIARGVWHQLAEPNGADRTARAHIVSALDLDIGAVK